MTASKIRCFVSPECLRNHITILAENCQFTSCQRYVSGHSGICVGGGHEVESAAVEVDGGFGVGLVRKPRAVYLPH